jgi:hypothetical protein
MDMMFLRYFSTEPLQADGEFLVHIWCLGNDSEHAQLQMVALYVSASCAVFHPQRIWLSAKMESCLTELESLSHLLTVCNVHCAAEVRVEETANETIIRKQYLNLISSLHTDKKRFPGDEAAFKLISEAYSILYISMKRYRYDIKFIQVLLMALFNCQVVLKGNV